MTRRLTLQFVNQDAPSDQRMSEIIDQSSQITFRTVNDAYTLSQPWLSVYRASGSYGVQQIVFPAGNVGIGTSSPGHKLDVADRMRIRAGSAGTAGLWLHNGTEDVAFIGDALNGYMGLWGNTGAGWGLVMNTTNGHVGLGTMTPTHKLSVNGTVRAKEVIVETTGWPDYVFADEYRLPSLSEVEAHIEEAGHLPGVPSAQEIAERGINVGEMQALLLAKIEELTLHQIRQEKELAVQSSILERVVSENAELRRRLESH